MLTAALSLLLVLQISPISANVISVTNSAQWGKWGNWEKCGAGSVARGFSLKVQQQLIIGDDTAVNGIRLHCAKCNPPHDEEVITSSFAPWGNWTETLWCDFGFLTKFMMRVEDSKPRRDNTAVNNIKFMCSDGKVLEGKGLSWGSYGTWSESCVHGIRGLKTKVQGLVPDDDKDNTGLNDSQFLCGD